MYLLQFYVTLPLLIYKTSYFKQFSLGSDEISSHIYAETCGQRTHLYPLLYAPFISHLRYFKKRQNHYEFIRPKQ